MQNGTNAESVLVVQTEVSDLSLILYQQDWLARVYKFKKNMHLQVGNKLVWWLTLFPHSKKVQNRHLGLW